MITTICGEDTVVSRDYFHKLRNEYKDRGDQIYDIKANEIETLNKFLIDSVSLFSQKLIFFTESLNKKISRRSTPALFTFIEELVKNKNIELIDWEESTTSRELKITKGIIIKEFKLPTSIFKLLDSCYPHNLKQFITILNSLPDKTDEMFIFIMLIKHVRNLFLIKSGSYSKSLQSWQVAKLKSQAAHWNLEKLMSFYEGLYRIEVGLKTGRNPFALKKSLDLITCYFL